MITMYPKSHFSKQRGVLTLYALFIIISIVIVLVALLAISRNVAVLSSSVDSTRQMSVEKRILEDVVWRAVMSKIGVAGENNTDPINDTIDSFLTHLNAGAGVTITRSATSPALPTCNMFPASGVVSSSVPTLANYPLKYQTSSLIASRAALLTASPLAWRFTRAVSNTTENRAYTVEANVWSVPLFNWPLIAYGLPATKGSAGVPKLAPTSAWATKLVSSVTSNGSTPLIVTTLKPGTSGDPTAFATLYRTPKTGENEILPRYYQNLTAIAWDAWEYIWGKYQTQLAGYASSSGTYFDLRNPPATAPTGLTLSGSTLTVDLALVSSKALTVVDATGGAVVNLKGNSASAIVLQVINRGSTKCTINVPSTATRPTALYAVNSNVVLASASFNGAVFLDPTSTISGTGTVRGMLAYYANTPQSSASSINLLPPDSALQTTLDAIVPRAVVVSTKAKAN